MDNLRLILFFTLAFLGLLLYQAWMQDYGKKPEQVSQQTSAQSAPASVQEQAGAGVPNAAVTPGKGQEVELGKPTQVNTGNPALNGEVIKVETDLLRLEISSRGGTVIRADLLKYPVSLKTPEVKFELLSPAPEKLFIAQSGLIGVKGSKTPTHEALYHFAKGSYRMAEGQRVLTVSMDWSDGAGEKVVKKYIFHRGSYLIDVRYEITNESKKDWSVREYGQLEHGQVESGKGFASRSYTGGVYYTPTDKYEKLKFKDMGKGQPGVDSDHVWIAMIQHYFFSAWIPPKQQKEHIYSNNLPGPKFILGSMSPTFTIPAEGSKELQRQLYIGPKLQDQLEKIADGLELTVDYGWLTVIAKPIFWLLKTIHNFVGNWGWAIIILTIIIKAAFFKLSETSYKSMANMRKFTPRLQALKDRYGDDKQRLNQAMMEMYKKEKINPLGGCLPIVVQIPVFIALYWVLLESVELRQAPFILWIDNLSAKDPYFILPLIMGVSMFIQQKLNPAPPDPMQAKMMMALPFIFTVFFAFFPAGLVLYWVVNNIISITQQWYITRKIEQGAK